MPRRSQLTDSLLNSTNPFKSVSWLMGEKITAVGINLFVTWLLARYLLPSGFGQLSYLMALVTLVTPFLTLGLNSIISREVLRRPDDVHEVMGTAVALRLLSALIFTPVAIILGFVYLGETLQVFFAVLMLSSIANSAYVIDFWMQAQLANRSAAIIRLASLLIFSVARILAIKFDASLAVFVYLAGLEMLALGLLYLFAYHRLSGGLRMLKISMSESKRLLMGSRWLLISGIAAVIYLKIDQVMLGLMIGERAVGIYAVAARISEVWYFIPAAIAVSVFPRLTKQREANKAIYGLELQQINDFLFCSGLLIAAIVTLLSDGLVLVFGETYAESVPILVTHVWTGVFVFMRALLSKWLIAEDLLKLSMFSQVLGALVNIILNLKLIPVYGPVGAAYATLISQAVAGYLVLFFHRDLWPMAMVVTRSIFLPIRWAQKGLGLYRN